MTAVQSEGAKEKNELVTAKQPKDGGAKKAEEATKAKAADKGKPPTLCRKTSGRKTS